MTTKQRIHESAKKGGWVGKLEVPKKIVTSARERSLQVNKFAKSKMGTPKFGPEQTGMPRMKKCVMNGITFLR